jgi:anti-sigma regulatory factor (Ser/Thr protein kinase)
VRHHRAVEAVTVPGVGAPRQSTLHVVQDHRQVSTIQQHTAAMGRAHGLDADAVDRLRIVVTEMARNIARHAGMGYIILRPVGEHATGCIEILALDKGPGIADMTRAMRDGGSPSGAPRRDGGFAAIRRLAGLFDIYSHVGRGTAVVAHVGAQSGRDSTCRCAESVIHGCVGAVCVPLHGEEECGDDWAVEVVPEGMAVLLVDGLGHGPGAAVAALAATSAFHDAAANPPEIVLGSMHTALRHTRGAALSVTVLDQSRRTARFCGVGNVNGRVVTADADRHLIPQSGIVGHTMPRARAADVAWPTGGRLLMHSDGISSRWRVDHYPGLLARHPALLAGVLFRDFAHDHDDATVLVLRETLPAASE